MNVRTLALAAVSLLALTPAVHAQCPVGQHASGKGTDLRLRLSPGQVRRVVTTMHQSMDQTVMGRQQHTDQVLTMGARFDVMKGTEGGSDIRMTYESVHVQLDNPMGHTDYDSAHPDSVVPRAAESYAALVGHSLVIHLAANGRVTGVTGVDSLLSAVVDAIDIPPGVSRDDLMKTLRRQFGDQAVEQMMQQALSVLPDRPVSVGDSWTCTATMQDPLPVTQVSTWTVRSRSHGIATMDVSIETRSDSTKSVPMAVGSMSLRYAVHGTMSGTTQVDEKTGWVVRSSTEGDMSGTMTVEGTPQGDIAVPMTMHLTSTLEPAGG